MSVERTLLSPLFKLDCSRLRSSNKWKRKAEQLSHTSTACNNGVVMRINGNRSKRVAWIFVSGACLAIAAFAARISVDFGQTPYSGIPMAGGTTVNSEGEVRSGALTQAGGLYRSEHGPNSLPPGSIIDATYGDGSGESGLVTSTTSSVGVEPIPGTQEQAGGGNQGCGDSGDRPCVHQDGVGPSAN